MEVIFGLIVVCLVALIVYERERSWRREQDLINRLMSRNFGDYTTGIKQMSAAPEQDVKVVADAVLDHLRNEEERYVYEVG